MKTNKCFLNINVNYVNLPLLLSTSNINGYLGHIKLETLDLSLDKSYRKSESKLLNLNCVALRSYNICIQLLSLEI